MLKDSKYIRDLKERKFKSSGGVSPNECWRPSAGHSKADMVEFHQENIRLRLKKRWSRQSSYNLKGVLPASVNPKTGKPHEHKREIARNLSRV
jgi:hypothetical protein